ncbi:MAG: B12-binding domain-containing radical SAM protein [Thiohalomonadaceae bacterium]
MRITFIHPAGFNFVPGQPDFSVLANRMAPIGILSLSAWLEQHGHECVVHDCLGPYAPRSLAENVDQILATKPEMVGFSTTTSAFMDAVEMINLIRDRQPAMKVICGGAHVSAVGPTLLQHFPEIDYLCIGEGEAAMRDLADGKPLHEVGNLVYRDGERIVANPRRSRLKELDELPFPAYEKLADFPHDYHLPIFSHIKRWGATMITSRGCPYTCTFYDRTVFERLYKYNHETPARQIRCPPHQHVVRAARYFSANQKEPGAAAGDFPLHPRQPLGLNPHFSPDMLNSLKKLKVIAEDKVYS